MPRDAAATRERILNAAEELVLQRGFAATSVDAVLAASATTKGAFFHHFASKRALGHALLERYATADVDTLDSFMSAAESQTDDPAGQLIAFVRRFEEAIEAGQVAQPGCLFVTFVYESQLTGTGADELIQHAIRAWRDRIRRKLEAAADSHDRLRGLDLEDLADHVFTTFEGGFILARAMNDPERLRAQLTQLRRYLELLVDQAN